MKKQKNQEKINLKTKLVQIDKWTILRLDKDSSSKLSSRGLAMVEGTMNDFRFQTALEPDGKGSHWFEVDKNLLKAVGVQAGDSVDLVIEQSTKWSEPKVPEDLNKALDDNIKAQTTWMAVTPFARWEWIRWIVSTKNPETRKIRIEKACSKLNSGMRRPCCFNSSQCTVPYLSNNGILLEPMQVEAIKLKIK